MSYKQTYKPESKLSFLKCILILLLTILPIAYLIFEILNELAK